MDKATIQQHLAEAEEQIAAAAQRIAAQRQLMAELTKTGRDVGDIVETLEIFEGSQALNLKHRERLEKLLAESKDDDASA